MRVLALDLATKTGWALWDGSRIESGVQDFSKRRGESNGMLFHRFNAWLSRICQNDDANNVVELCVFEQAHHRGGAATEIAVGLMTRVLEFCAVHGIDHAPVHPLTLKKWATGSGKANKSMMMKRAYEISNSHLITDDNEGDAICLLAYAMEKFGGETCNVRSAAAAAPVSPTPENPAT